MQKNKLLFANNQTQEKDSVNQIYHDIFSNNVFKDLSKTKKKKDFKQLGPKAINKFDRQ